MQDAAAKVRIVGAMDKMAISADAIARALMFAIEQLANVDVGEIMSVLIH